MKTKTKFRKGFTIIELAVAILTSAIVILAIGVIIVFGQTSWNLTWKKVNLQRDASYAMLRMTRSIQAAKSAKKSSNDRVLYIPDANNPSITFSYVVGTNDLQFQIGARTPQTIINGKVENLQFNVHGNTVIIDLTLKDGDVQTQLVSTVMMRNS